MKRISFLISLLLCSHQAFAQQAANELIPDLVSPSALGKTWSEVITMSPNLVISNFGVDGPQDAKPDPAKPKEGLSAKLHDPEGFLMFNFVNGKLEGILLSRKGNQATAERFMELAKALFGNENKMSTDSTAPGFDIHTWSTKDALIQAFVPQKDRTGDISLRILDVEYAENIGASP